MMPFSSSRILAVGLALALVVAAAMAFRTDRSTEMTAYFTQTKGLHVGDEVRVLDVPIGEVTSIQPLDDSVRVRFRLEDQQVPDDARATIVAPTMVSVRHIALSPVFSPGDTALADGATIGLSRTAVRVEWDQMKQQMVRLAQALGPEGADEDGSVRRLLETSAANLDGRGADLNRTLVALSRAMSTLSDNRGQVFATVRNLQVFTDALASSDATVREFNQQLASVSDLLDDDRIVLARTLRSLATSLQSVRTFVRDNRSSLVRNVEKLDSTAKIFSDNRQALADTLQTAPTALSNFYNIYDPNVPAMTGYFSLAQFQSPAAFVCSTLYYFGGTPQQCRNLLAPVAEQLAGVPPLPIDINPIERNGRSRTEPAPGTSGDDTRPQNRSSLDGLDGLVTGGRP